MRVSLEKCLLCNQFPGLKKFESTCHKGEKNNFGFLTAASLPVYTVSLFCKTTRHGMGWKRSQIFYLRVPEVVYWHYRPWTTSDFCRQLLSRLDSLRASLIFFSTIQYNSPIHFFLHHRQFSRDILTVRPAYKQKQMITPNVSVVSSASLAHVFLLNIVACLILCSIAHYKFITFTWQRWR